MSKTAKFKHFTFLSHVTKFKAHQNLYVPAIREGVCIFFIEETIHLCCTETVQGYAVVLVPHFHCPVSTTAEEDVRYKRRPADSKHWALMGGRGTDKNNNILSYTVA